MRHNSFWEAARSLVLLAPRWERVQATPLRMLLLTLLSIGWAAALQQGYVDEGAGFDWTALTRGWCAITILTWAAYAVRTARAEARGAPPAEAPAADTPFSSDPQLPDMPGPDTARLITVVLAQLALITGITGLIFVLLPENAFDRLSEGAYTVVYYSPAAWAALAQATLLVRAASGWQRLLAAIAVALACAANVGTDPTTYWKSPAAADAPTDAFALSQEVMEAQAPLLDEQLEALAPQRPGVVDLYSITFAPYEGEEVFRRESAMVTDVMRRRFGATGRALQLVNHRATSAQFPWATPLNLQRAIEGVAGQIDLAEDILFIHLTSHGASNGELAAQFAPMQVAPVMPAELRSWLDAAGIRYRVLSISACFAGNWIAPLRADGTLVMTASDADHTSYGCGSKSDLTFFGRAMYDEQLRTQTTSFVDAHAAARTIIKRREEEAGKDDGYSNPQISVGKLIAPRLALIGASPRSAQNATP